MADQTRDLLDQLRAYGSTLEQAADREPVVISAPRYRPPSWLARHATPIVLAASVLGVASAVAGLATQSGPTKTTAPAVGSTVPRVSPSTMTRPTTSNPSTSASTATAVLPPGEATTSTTTAEPGTAVPGEVQPPAPSIVGDTLPLTPTTPTTIPGPPTIPGSPEPATTTTTAPTTTTTLTSGPTSAAIVSAFPHLQLALPINTWSAPNHARTSRVVGDTIDGAFKSVFRANDKTATLVLSTVVFAINPTDRLQVRGHPAETIIVENTVTIRWQEAPGITAVLTTTNLTPSETVAIAMRQVVATSEEEWIAIVARSTENAAPTPWERVVNGAF
jgi:hypothetical protein